MNRLTSACVLSIVLVGAIVAGWSSRAAAPPDETPKSVAAQIKELQQERAKLLDDAVKMLNTQYQTGAVAFAELRAAEREWLEARLDAAETPQQRLTALNELQESAKELVKTVEVRFNSGLVSQVDLVRAKAWRLEVQIKLLCEKRAPGAEKK
jgi:outer membrane protein TolC